MVLFLDRLKSTYRAIDFWTTSIDVHRVLVRDTRLLTVMIEPKRTNCGRAIRLLVCLFGMSKIKKKSFDFKNADKK